jgi:hypothetical protein
MAEIWSALGALAVILLPLALAGWLLARSDRRVSRGKMPRRNGHRTDAD